MRFCYYLPKEIVVYKYGKIAKIENNTASVLLFKDSKLCILYASGGYREPKIQRPKEGTGNTSSRREHPCDREEVSFRLSEEILAALCASFRSDRLFHHFQVHTYRVCIDRIQEVQHRTEALADAVS